MEGMSLRYCSHCGKEILDEAIVCPHCGCSVKESAIVDNTPSVGLNVLSFFIPLVGLILFLAYIDKMPVKAKAIGKFALIGFVIGIVISIIAFVIFGFINPYI